MDFWDHLFDNEYKRRADIEALKRSSRIRQSSRRQERQQIESQEKRIEQLEDQVGKLALLCRSLLTVLRESDAVDPERLQEVMNQIDGEDGVMDGKITTQPPSEDPPAAPDIKTW